MTISKKEAEDRLWREVTLHSLAIDQNVTVELSQSQYDALTSLIFNIGVGAFKSSTLLQALNKADYVEATFQFFRWSIADGKRSLGLLRRRTAEAKMFNEALGNSG